MSDPQRAFEISLADRVDRAAAAVPEDSLGAVVGLDGFIDEIVHIVDKRESSVHYDRMETISRLSERVASAAGRSANIELVTQRIKIGGNGPIMANALDRLGASVSYIGNLGHPELHPVFRNMAARCRIFSLAEPAHTDALEFNDGKIMLGKMDVLSEITWNRLLDVVGLNTIISLLDSARLLALVNWTMLPFASDIWEKLLSDVCPKLSDAERFAFFDLADPEKRTPEDIARMLDLVREFSKFYRVIFGLNERESRQIARAFGVAPADSERMPPEEISAFVSEKIGVYCVVVHPVTFAVATVDGKTSRQDGPTTPRPLITTGGGDHFNAGFCTGALLGLDPETSLLMAVCCSGFYVMNARTPTLAELTAFMRNWRDRPFIKD